MHALMLWLKLTPPDFAFVLRVIFFVCIVFVYTNYRGLLFWLSKRYD